jgi:hypothetical protein
MRSNELIKRDLPFNFPGRPFDSIIPNILGCIERTKQIKTCHNFTKCPCTVKPDTWQRKDEKMKTLLRFVMVLTLATVILLPATRVSANATRIEFTVSETCDNDLTNVREWSAGPNFHATGITQTCHDLGSIPQVTGTVYLTDGNMHYVGNNAIMTGLARFETDEGGVWVGRWTFSAGVFILVAHGAEMYEGQQYFGFHNLNSGLNKGYILMPGG